MKYELKKIISDKIIWLSLIVMVLAAVYISFTNFNINTEEAEVVSEYAGKYDDKLINEIEDILEAYENSDNQEDISDIESYEIDNIKSGYMYIKYKILFYEEVNEYRQNIVNRAERLMKSDDGYVAKLNQKIYEDYQGNIEFEMYYSSFMEDALSKSSTYIIIISVFLTCIFAIRIFSVDIDNGTLSIIRSSARGRIKVYSDKLKALMLLNFIMIIIDLLILLLPEFIYGKLSDFLQPVQSISYFQKSPYKLNFLQLYLAILILMFVGLAVISAIAVVMNIILRKIVLSLTCAAIISGACYFCSYYILVKNILIKNGFLLEALYDERIFTVIVTRFTNIFLISQPHMYLKLSEYINIFEIPVSVLSLVLFVNILLLCVLFALGYVIYNKRYRKNGH